MQEWHQRIKILTKPRFFPLRYRFIALSSLLLAVLLGIIALIVGVNQSRVIRINMEKRGLAMAQSLAATSKAALATYNYIALEQTVNQAHEDPEVVYVVIHDKEGRVAGYSGRPDLQGTLLNDPVSRTAISESGTSLTQESTWGPDRVPVLDIAAAAYIPGSNYRWGTVRVGLSLREMHRQIRQIQLIIGVIGLVAVLVGVAVSVWAARGITRPLGVLVEATVQAARGNLNQDIQIDTRDEVGVLAGNFNEMIGEILAQREQLEERLSEIRRLQQYTQKLLTTMSDGLISVDRAGNVVTINPAACEMLGFSETSAEGSPMAALLKNKQALLGYINDMIHTSSGNTQREIHINGGQDPQVILAAASALTDADNTIKELIVNLHDVTALKRLEAEMRQTERLAALGTLAAGMAHEIRNPLSAIKTFVQLLPRKLEKPGFLEKFNRTVPRELNRINQLIEDLLQLARKPQYRFQVLSLGAILRQCEELFEEDLIRKEIVLRMDFFPDPLPNFKGDPDQFMKALQNLFMNAIHAMPGGGVFHVSAIWQEENPLAKNISSDQKGWIKVTFKDTGIGIPEESLKNIWNPFFTTKDSGTGLGLAISHKVITEHAGHMDVTSREGAGTVFFIFLPALKDGDFIAL